ncbi:MAG: DNA-processing protein DprA [Candidatus Enterosoma sp.]|nr:DNA-processing protein DprA [Mollicutes bacterium]MDY5851795.1 DNA-processing protein DprA [Candidatus Enterosoma sp.]
MDLRARKIRTALSKHCKGNWSERYQKRTKKEARPQEEIDQAFSDRKANRLMIGDCEYPDYFTNCPYPPRVRYYYGNLSLRKTRYRLTCVGTRKPTIYQHDTCARLIEEIEDVRKNKVAIVSGRAAGLDEAFRRAARKKNAPVIAVLGSGIDFCYPDKNKDIYEYCKSGKGLVISEYPGNLAPKQDNFLFRNRLMAARSEVVFIGGGSARRSGTKSTVRYALDRNKEVMALPCNITGDDLTNTIIQEGAQAVLTSQDILDQLKDCYRKEME